MRAIEFYYTLDVVFKKGVNSQNAKKLRSDRQKIDHLYNPMPTMIYLCCTVNKKYLKVAVGQKIRPAEWNFDQKAPSTKHGNYLDLRTVLDKYRASAALECMILRSKQVSPTPDEIKRMIIRTIGGEEQKVPENNFWSCFHQFLDEKKKMAKPATIEKYHSLRKALESFESKNYPLAFNNMTMKFYNDFLGHSRDVLKHLNNTSSKNVRNIRAFLGWAVEEGFHSLTDYKKFKCENDTPVVIHLTKEELRSIATCDLSGSPSKLLSRDIFLFQCYTGQRIGDVQKLTIKDIVEAAKGKLTWCLYQEKGNKKEPVNIPLMPEAVDIFQRYAKDKQPYQNLFPSQSTVMTNKNLKLIGREAGIDSIQPRVSYRGKDRVDRGGLKYKHIGTHVARKTFVTLMMENGMSDDQIRSITGHSSVKQMRPYKGSNQQLLLESMAGAFW